MFPFSSNISPGELQNAENALDFARDLVVDWLSTYKFRDWHTHSSTKKQVTADERRQRAKQIADQLRDHSRWKTHGRSLKIDDLRQMKLYVTDYSSTPELADAIRRYYTLLQMTFATNIYKIFETPVLADHADGGRPISEDLRLERADSGPGGIRLDRGPGCMLEMWHVFCRAGESGPACTCEVRRHSATGR